MATATTCQTPAHDAPESGRTGGFFRSSTKKRYTEEEKDRLVQQFVKEVGSEVHEALVRGGDEGVTEVSARRYLRAERWDFGKAVERMRKQAKWRAEYVPEGQIDSSGIEGELAAEKVFLQPPDKEGRSVLVVLVKNHVYSKEREKATSARFTAYSLDLAIQHNDTAKNPEGKLVALFDLSDMKYKNLDSVSAIAMFKVLEQRYPERIDMIWIYNAPTIFWTIWKIIEPAIDRTTRKRIKFVYGEEAIQEVVDTCGADSLPPEYGGRGSLVKIQDCWRKRDAPQR